MRRNVLEEGPHPLDVALGARVRLRRKELGLSQGNLADALGITFQQVQKYEHGTNRISFSRLTEMSSALKCSLADLIGDLESNLSKPAQARQIMRLAQPGARDLLSAYGRIASAKQRRALLELARQLVSEQQAETGAPIRKGR